MRYGYIALMVACIGIAGCTAEERKAIQEDSAAYVGAPADAAPGEIIGDAAEGAGKALASGGLPGLVYYIGAGAVAIGLGYIKRKALGSVLSKAIAKGGQK